MLASLNSCFDARRMAFAGGICSESSFTLCCLLAGAFGEGVAAAAGALGEGARTSNQGEI